MKKLWACVYMYGGIISNVKIFETRERAEAWFNTLLNGVGGIDACESYTNTESCMWFYYPDDGRHPEEVTCSLVNVE